MLSDSVGRRDLIDRILGYESPSFPLLPEGSDSLSRSFSLPMTTEAEADFLLGQRVVLRMLAADPPILVATKGADAPAVKGSRFTKWLKGLLGSGHDKLAASMLAHGFLRCASTDHHGGFEARSHYAVQPLQQRYPRSMNAFAAPSGARMDAVALSIDLATHVAAVMESFMTPDEVVPLAAVRSCKTWYDFKKSVLQLQLVDVQSLCKTDQRVFFINLYRVMLFDFLVGVGKPLTHDERVRFFDEIGYNVGSEFYTLNSIDYIRLLSWNAVTPPSASRSWARLQGDARVHFALQNSLDVSPSICIYRPENIDAALDAAAQVAIAHMVSVLPSTEQGKPAIVRLHKLFRWYEECFSNSRSGVLPWLSRFSAAVLSLEPFDNVTVTYDEGMVRSASENSFGLKIRASGGTLVAGGGSGASGASLGTLPVAALSAGGLMVRQGSAQVMMEAAGGRSVAFVVQHGNRTLDVSVDPRGSVWDLKVAIWRVDDTTLPTEMAIYSPSSAVVDNACKIESSGLVSGVPVAVRRLSPVSSRRMTDGSSLVANKFNVASKKAVLNAACFLGGRGVTRATVGTRTMLQFYVVDASYALVPPSPSLAKTIEVHIVQGPKKTLVAGLAINADHFVVSFCSDVIASGDTYRVVVLIGGREACGGLVVGKLLDLTNPQVTVRAQCRSSEWGHELAVACSQMSNVVQEIGCDALVGLVLTNQADSANVLTPLVTPMAKCDEWGEFFSATGANGIFAIAILANIDYFRVRVVASDVKELARVAGRALLAVLPSRVPPSFELCDCVLSALSSCECWMLAAAVFSAMVVSGKFDSLIEEKLLPNLCFVKAFSCTNVDALRALFCSLRKFLDENKLAVKAVGAELVGGIVAGIRCSVLSVRHAALHLALLTMTEHTMRFFVNLNVDVALRETLADEQVLVVVDWQESVLAACSHANQPSKLSDTFEHNLVLTLQCLRQCLLHSLGAAQPKMSASALLHVLMTLTSAACAEVANLAWVNLLLVVARLDDKAQLGEVFFQRMVAKVRSLLDEGHVDLAGIPFASLGNAAAESVRVGSVLALAKLIGEDRPWRKVLTLALGGPFLQAYVGLIASGSLEPADVVIDAAEVVRGKVLGSGASGTVYLSKWRGVDVAVKSVNEDSLSFSLREFLSEMALMNIVRHRNIAHLLGGSIRPGNYFLMSRFYERGALDAILATPSIDLSEEHKFRIGLQVARAMKYLHAMGVMHRDLKPANVLIDIEWTAAVCDFGVSRCVDTNAALTMTRGVGTPLYIAPEVLEGTVYDNSADVFSFAVCFWQIVEREEPYKGVNYMLLVPLIVQEHLRPKIGQYSLRYGPLLGLCWNVAPAKRPTFEQLVPMLKQVWSADSSLEDGTRPANMPRTKTGRLGKGSGVVLRKSTTEIEYK